MGESNTVVSVYTLYRYLQQYRSYPSILCKGQSHRPRIGEDDNGAFSVTTCIHLLYRTEQVTNNRFSDHN